MRHAVLALMAAALLAAGCRPGEKSGGATGKPVLGEKELAFASQKLASMRDRVELLSFAPGKVGATDEEIFFDQLAALQPKITRTSRSLETDAAVARDLGIAGAPSVIIKGGDNTRLRYFGMPSGYEFTVFLETIERVSANQPAVTAKGAAALADLRVPVNIKIFVTPS
jgi:hypothetical protein